MFGLGIREYLILGLVAALAALGWYAKHETEQVGAEKSSRLTAEATAKDNAAQVDALQAIMRDNDAAFNAMQARASAADKRSRAIEEEISHAEDGPVAPALALALDRLRNDGGNPQAGDSTGSGSGVPHGSR